MYFFHESYEYFEKFRIFFYQSPNNPYNKIIIYNYESDKISYPSMSHFPFLF